MSSLFEKTPRPSVLLPLAVVFAAAFAAGCTGGAEPGGGHAGGSGGAMTPGSGGSSAVGSGATGGSGTTGGASGAGGAAGNGLGGTTSPGGTGAGGSSAGTAGTGGLAAGGSAGSGTAGNGAASGNGGSAGGTLPYPKPDSLPDETGADLWLRYPKVPVEERRSAYEAAFKSVVVAGTSNATLDAARAELVKGLTGLTGVTVSSATAIAAGAVVIGTGASATIKDLSLVARLSPLGPEGYLVEPATTSDGQAVTVVAGNTEIGALYGAFALLRHLASHRALEGLSLSGSPRIQHRILDHWDNLDGTVERGYAGRSLWNWGALPGTLSPRYTDYARANASLGINGAVLTNVNADANVLKPEYIAKVKALADVFRPYGIHVYLTALFSAPTKIGGLSTADPNDAGVKQWWAAKADEIYAQIPDFGGFLVKANSEGQPGPQDYGRTHADGANMLAAALAPHGGLVMWRAFVYSSDNPPDRIKQAYEEFKPLDGKFASNVLLQVKNGPLDFQPREPFSPLFGAMPKTSLALEVQITKEYLGEDTHLAYLGPLYEEVLRSDTRAQGTGSTVAKVIDGSLDGHTTTAIAGVANIGSDTNWTGSHMNQANWYVFGRLAWDPNLDSESIADEWVRQTFSNDPVVVEPLVDLMLDSRQVLVNYMTPLGLAHIMGTDHHYGPAPWVDNLDHAEWEPVYYHRADAAGLGFDRTSQGSNAVAQYADPVRDMYENRDTTPNEALLFFHHIGWQDGINSGRTLWEELVDRYSRGVDDVGRMRTTWASLDGYIDAARFADVTEFLQIQHYEARWWRDACLTYFGTFSKQPIPSGYAPAANTLSFYQNLKCPSDATKPRCPSVYTGDPSPAVLTP